MDGASAICCCVRLFVSMLFNMSALRLEPISGMSRFPIDSVFDILWLLTGKS